jgi:hypothetical protein
VRKALFVLSILLFFTGVEPGSAGGLPSANAISRELEGQLPGVRFERESHIHLGRIALAFIKPIARWALDEDDEARTYLAAIRKIDVATYRVVGMPRTADGTPLRRIEKRMLENDWVRMVRTREVDDNTWVFLRYRPDGSIRSLFVIELDQQELSIVGVEGRIDDLLAEAIADEPGEFAGLFGS